MNTLPISISICGVFISSSSSSPISYYVDPSKDDESTNIKFYNVFTFLVFSKLSLPSQSSESSLPLYEILKGQSTLIASGMAYALIIIFLLTEIIRMQG